MTDFYYFHDQLWRWRYSGLSLLYWCSLVHSRSRKKETGSTDVITSMHRVLSVFPISKYSFVYIFHHSLFTPASEKRWNKPARLASFRLLCPCQEKMWTDVTLMPAREAGADEGLWECGQNSERWWQSAADANAELANLQRVTPEREPIK